MGEGSPRATRKGLVLILPLVALAGLICVAATPDAAGDGARVRGGDAAGRSGAADGAGAAGGGLTAPKADDAEPKADVAAERRQG